METADDRYQRRDRLLPANREETEADSKVFGSPGRVQKPGGHRDQELFDHSRYRCAFRVSAFSRRPGFYFAHDPGYGTAQSDGAADVACRKHGLTGDLPELSTASFRRFRGEQLSLLGP